MVLGVLGMALKADTLAGRAPYVVEELVSMEKGLVFCGGGSDNNDKVFRQESGRSSHLYSRSPYLFPPRVSTQEIGRKISSLRKDRATRHGVEKQRVMSTFKRR